MKYADNVIETIQYMISWFLDIELKFEQCQSMFGSCLNTID